MNIKFLERHNEVSTDGRISFWSPEVKFSFEITWDEEKEDISLFENELKLNLENQLSVKYFNFHQKPTLPHTQTKPEVSLNI